MATTRSSSSSSTLLVIIILILTFPIWIGVGGALIGVMAGLFGVAIGLVAALFAGAVALIVLPFKILFGWGDWSCGWPDGFGFHDNGYVWLAVLIFAALVINRRKK
jgi:hypothetical protein